MPGLQQTHLFTCPRMHGLLRPMRDEITSRNWVRQAMTTLGWQKVAGLQMSALDRIRYKTEYVELWSAIS